MTRTRVIDATEDAIAEAAQILRQGGLVAMPTETVYGLAADATQPLSVAAIFAAKGRPTFNPLIVHVSSIEMARRLTVFDQRAEQLAAAFWPGPLTLTLPRRLEEPIADLVSAGLPSLAIRMPAHPVARHLLALCERPLAAPSANISGHISSTCAEHVLQDLDGQIDLILDAGSCAVGLESTIVGLGDLQAKLLRSGGIEQKQIEKIIGPLMSPTDAKVEAPGMLTSHYAPSCKLRLNAVNVDNNEALLAFGPNSPKGAALTVNLSHNCNLAEAAANLFAYLRQLDQPGIKSIAVMPIPEIGLGIAINDRLRRAAAPRAERL